MKTIDVAQAIITSCTTSSIQSITGYKKEIDTIWIGSSAISSRQGKGIKSNSETNLNDNYDNGMFDSGDFGGNNNYNDDDDDNDFGNDNYDIGFTGDNFESNPVVEIIPETTGLEIAVKGGLLEANRKVEKISIG